MVSNVGGIRISRVPTTGPYRRLPFRARKMLGRDPGLPGPSRVSFLVSLQHCRRDAWKAAIYVGWHLGTSTVNIVNEHYALSTRYEIGEYHHYGLHNLIQTQLEIDMV